MLDNWSEEHPTCINGFYWDPLDWEIPDSWTIWDMATKRPPPGWLDLFKRCQEILKEIDEDHHDEDGQMIEFRPEVSLVFRAFEMTPLELIRIIIIGQDPYYDVSRKTGRSKACGAAFSLNPDEPLSIAPSLANIFKELKKEYPKYKIPKHGDLSYWMNQGVLLLNKDLTVKPGKAGTLEGYWRPFLNEIVKAIRKARPKAVWMLWGKNAQELESVIQSEKYVLKSPHPSPMSADRGFFGNNHFKEANRLLLESKQEEIDWQIPDG
jgi:uracil-DNA glycosylase